GGGSVDAAIHQVFVGRRTAVGRSAARTADPAAGKPAAASDDPRGSRRRRRTETGPPRLSLRRRLDGGRVLPVRIHPRPAGGPVAETLAHGSADRTVQCP